MSAERLDLIEDEMETIKELLIATARMAERTSASIDRLTERLDHQTRNIDRLAVSQLNSEERVDQLVSAQLNSEYRVDQLGTRVDQLVSAQLNSEHRVDQVGTRVDQLAALMVRFIENAEADRTVIRGIQTENQRILEYLFGQQGES